MEKVQNKMCNVKGYSYDVKTKKLLVNYKISGNKIYHNFSKESYDKISNLNGDRKTIGIVLAKELKKNK